MVVDELDGGGVVVVLVVLDVSAGGEVVEGAMVEPLDDGGVVVVVVGELELAGGVDGVVVVVDVVPLSFWQPTAARAAAMASAAKGFGFIWDPPDRMWARGALRLWN